MFSAEDDRERSAQRAFDSIIKPDDSIDKLHRAMIVCCYVAATVLAFWTIVVGTMIFQVCME